MKGFISDMEIVMYEDALEILQAVKEEMIILDLLNYD
jgi:hypothetical protein